MTEEQKKKCEEIYNLYLYLAIINIAPMPLLYKGDWIKMTILLAGVFSRDITEKEAEEIINNINKNIMDTLTRSLPVLINYKDTFWEIANYFDNNNKENKNNE